MARDRITCISGDTNHAFEELQIFKKRTSTDAEEKTEILDSFGERATHENETTEESTDHCNRSVVKLIG